MWFKLLSILGIIAGASCIGAAIALYPGGFDWNRDFISTLLRGQSGPARVPAIAGVLLFCASIAAVFQRLSRAAEFFAYAKVIRIAGIGSMVYAALAFTPMHDLMVTISLIFFLVAALALTRALFEIGEMGFFVAGCVCLVVLLASATLYYAGIYVTVLPWAQRLSFPLFAVWLVSLDCRFPRARSR